MAEQAIRYPTLVFTTLLYRIEVDFLGEAYQRTRTDSAPGIEGVTAEEYAEHLEENLGDRHERIQSGRYRAPPVKRTWALQGGWESAADRQADVRGQDGPTGGGVAVGGYLRAGLLGVLVGLPGRLQSAPGITGTARTRPCGEYPVDSGRRCQWILRYDRPSSVVGTAPARGQ
jgi:hypothetical protein